MLQISSMIPIIKDRYYLDEDGNLYTDFGQKRLKDCTQYKGYVKNWLCLKDGHGKAFFRHRLMLMCYNPVDDMEILQVNHINGIKTDNRLVNLEWCNNQYNRIHAVEHNLAARLKGEDNPYSKLTEQDVMEIIDLLLEHKLTQTQIAKIYNCNKCTINSIKNKRNWYHLTKDIVFD